MIERGTVRGLEGRLVTLELVETEACEACHNPSCKAKRQAIQAWNADDFQLREGDTIEVEVRGETQLKGALWVLGLPLALLVVGYALLRFLAPASGELGYSLGGLGGLALGMLIGVQVQKKARHESLPQVQGILGPESLGES